MRKYLLPRLGKFYKANMHTHSTLSDGKYSPVELKQMFMEKGYSIVAFSDHEVIVPHPELKSEDFLPITSYELSVSDGAWTRFTKCYHLNLYFKDESTTTSATFCKNAVWSRMQHLVTEEMEKRGTESREYSKEFIQWIIDTAKKENAFVCYNHPVWSLQNYSDYSGLKGFWGVEWHNTGCTVGALTDTTQPLLDLLGEGERQVFPIASDDCHGARDMFGGWVCVKARSLDYDTVFTALEKGDLYSSNGPEIKALYVEDGKVHIKTSAAEQICFLTDMRWSIVKRREERPLKEAEFSLEEWLKCAKDAPEGHNCWIRLEVIDKYGRRALTRAYFLEEILKGM